MKWFKLESRDEEITEEEISPILVYLSPEALKNAFLCILHMHTYVCIYSTTTYSPNLNTLG